MTDRRGRRIVSGAAGVARVFGATARGMALDAAAAASIAGETITRSARREGGRHEDGRHEDGRLATVRVDALILSDENGTPLTTTDRVRAALRSADRILREGAAIRIRGGAIATVREPAPQRTLDPRKNRGLLFDDIGGHTAFFRRHLADRAPLAVVGDPVTIVVVRSVGGNATGCSLGMTADWVVCEAALFDETEPAHYDDTVLAHELCHALNLPHARDRENLMYPMSSPPDDCRGTALSAWQRALLHANRHTVPPT